MTNFSMIIFVYYLYFYVQNAVAMDGICHLDDLPESEYESNEVDVLSPDTQYWAHSYVDCPSTYVGNCVAMAARYSNISTNILPFPEPPILELDDYGIPEINDGNDKEFHKCRNFFFNNCENPDYQKLKEYKKLCDKFKGFSPVVAKASKEDSKGLKISVIACNIQSVDKYKFYDHDIRISIDGKTKQGTIRVFVTQPHPGIFYADVISKKDGIYVLVQPVDKSGITSLTRIFIIEDKKPETSQWCLKIYETSMKDRVFFTRISDVCKRV